MERRYLVATIAMAATFAIFSHAFGSGLLTKLHEPHQTLISEMQCAAETLRAELLDKVNRSLGSGSAEQAQLRVEFNLPAPAFAAVAPAPPAPPARPSAVAIKAPSAPAIACPARLVSEVRVSQDFDQQMQAKMIAMESRLQASAVQREVAAAVRAQTRLAAMQTKVAHLSCRGSEGSNWSNRVVRLRSNGNGQVINIDLDMNRLSKEINEEVSRSLANSVRNF
jgi:DNA-binding protein YbaB